MKKAVKKLAGQQGMTLIEMVAASGVLALLTLMLTTGLFMAQRSYYTGTSQAESQLLLSTLSDLLSNELRYARDVTADGAGTLQRYTSVNYGRNTTLSLNTMGQLEANGRQMLSTGAYGNGALRIDHWRISYDGAGLFQVTLEVSGTYSGSEETTFSVRCLNSSSG